MKSERTRRAFAELAIGLMVCGAVHMFMIAPQNAQLAKLQAEADAAGGTNAPSAALSAEQLAQLTAAAVAKADRVTRLSEAARDETRLFSAIMTLADQSSVQIDQLQPNGEPAGAKGQGTAAATPAPPSPPAPPAADGAAPVAVLPPEQGAVGYSMVVSATYSDLVTFLAALPRDIGFTVVRSVRAEPGEAVAAPGVKAEDRRVRAHIETEHYWFDAKRLKSLAGADGDSAGEQATGR